MRSPIAQLLLALAAVMLAGRLVGWVFRRIGQPAVVGEVVGGILLGPSLLGALWPAAYGFLLPPSILPVIGAVAELGVVLYMFLVGLELDTGALRGQIRATVTIACGAIAIRFALGAGLGLYLMSSLAPDGVSTTSFALFMGIAMSIVAFPVLARILAEMGLSRTDLGVRALGVAAVADLVAWCILAVVIGIVQARPEQAVVVALATAVFVLVILGVVRPALKMLIRTRGDREPGDGVLAMTVAGLFVIAWAAHSVGVHAIAAAFLVGAAIPHESRLAQALTSRLEHVVALVLLPAFFAYMGMKTEMGLVTGLNAWLITALIVFVATAGTFGSTFVAARAIGRPARESAALGVLMNTRGLMELVVLNIGLELGVIAPTLFAMMVVMALVTTLMTTPVLRRVM